MTKCYRPGGRGGERSREGGGVRQIDRHRHRHTHTANYLSSSFLKFKSNLGNTTCEHSKYT